MTVGFCRDNRFAWLSALSEGGKGEEDLEGLFNTARFGGLRTEQVPDDLHRDQRGRFKALATEHFTLRQTA